MELKQPKVSVVMLMSPGREDMQCRAISSIKNQTYQNIEVVAFDTSHLRGSTIGYMRNVANAAATGELIAHADDDDISHARRIEEQVALLSASGKQVVGFRELLFWDTRNKFPKSTIGGMPANEAWIYRNHQTNWAAGASLLYTRELWEKQPFDDAPHEDTRWMRTELVNRECVGVSACQESGWMNLNPPLKAWERFREAYQDWADKMRETGYRGELVRQVMLRVCEPRIVCGIHGTNSESYDREVMIRNPDVWRRAPEFDAYCERTMKL